MMELLEKDPWFLSVAAFQFFGSLAALGLLIGRWRRNGALLRYEPRRPVPWGVAGAMLAVAFTAMSISSALASDGASIDFANQDPRRLMLSLAASMVMQSLGPILLLFIAATSKASWSDIGLPSRCAAAWAGDVAIGVIACMAAIVPVGLANVTMRSVLKLPNELTKHPLVEMLTKSEPEIFVLALATVMAVVVAPIGEEITFRLMLQGWLEKWEDRRLGWRNTTEAESPREVVNSTTDDLDAPQALPPEFESVTTTSPPRIGVLGLPYGWAPIIASSLMFAAAHFGYGPEPVPLFVLALILGYCYQRSHRIMPCIVAHGLFNLLSMIALWRVVFLGGD